MAVCVATISRLRRRNDWAAVLAEPVDNAGEIGEVLPLPAARPAK